VIIGGTGGHVPLTFWLGVVILEISMSDVILNSYVFVIGLIFMSSDTSLAHSIMLTYVKN